jgi:2-succinyl-5-enolpyruvyl-6-hydroxy-3-cyclohexene-1-carboxylate synthase
MSTDLALRLQTAPNINTVWCLLLIEELERLGVRDVAVSPGSRNTPLITALIGSDALRVESILDERAAGFYALGCAKAGRPAAVVTTSGTAVMNLLPAVTEAKQSGLPLLVLSADRPVALRDCGSNQTIDQLGPLAPLVKWQHDLPAPDDRRPARLALTALDEAVRRATSGWPGPVQLNCAFDKPLEPSPQAWDRASLLGLDGWVAGAEPFVSNLEGVSTPDLEPIAAAVDRAERGLLVVGNAPDGGAIRALAERLQWPLLADPASGMRVGAAPGTLIRHAQLMRELPQPDLVLQFGSRPVSGKLETWLEELPVRRILIDPADERRNPGHVPLYRVTGSIADCAVRLASACGARPLGDWTRSWQESDDRIATAIEAELAATAALTEAQIARDVASGPARIFAGNSLPVRHLGALVGADAPRGDVACSRGASGIDGVLATACGTAVGAGAAITLLIGDLSLLHDLNSLLLARRLRQKVLIVVIHNGGGAIFEHLPVAQFPDVKSPLCDAAHDVRLAPLAESCGLPTWSCRTRPQWDAAWTAAQACVDSCLIEAIVPRDGHRNFMRSIRRRLSDG